MVLCRETDEPFIRRAVFSHCTVAKRLSSGCITVLCSVMPIIHDRATDYDTSDRCPKFVLEGLFVLVSSTQCSTRVSDRNTRICECSPRCHLPATQKGSLNQVAQNDCGTDATTAVSGTALI
uniref:Uncharacterized protein n=1 Tax=Schistocephalus solidus TaxID=70667 RepID=A0A0X3P3R7_SCHSO